MIPKTSNIGTEKFVNYMIVDDHGPFRKMIHAFLPGCEDDHGVAECQDGSEAVSRYKELQPDWVLMDLQMAQMDGLTATREILKDFPDARIIVLTQFDSPEIRKAAESAGAFAFVLKENLNEVTRILNEYETKPLESPSNTGS